MRSAVILLALGLTSGCLPTSEQVDLQAPWQDGELTRYDVVTDDGRLVDAAAWAIHREGEGWALRTREVSGQVSEAVLDARLRPLSGTSSTASARTELRYGEETITISKHPKKGDPSTETLPRPVGALDNAQLLQTLRALPFAEGHVAIHRVVGGAGSMLPATVTVVDRATLDGPAGPMETWHVVLDLAWMRHEAWYAAAPPHLLVRYRNPLAKETYQLRSWRLGLGAEDVGPVPDPAVPEPGQVPVAWGLVAMMAVIQVPVMGLVPILLGFWLARRFRLGWKLWAAGAAAFVASQVVHLPLNWAVGLMGPPRGLGLLSLPGMAVAAGLSAGLCEEIARYLVLRFGLQRLRRSKANPQGSSPGFWQEALQFGAGHGGIEAMIMALLTLVSLSVMLVLHWVPGILRLEPDTLRQTLEAADGFWHTPIPLTLAGAVERLSALTAHVAMTVLVMRTVATRNLAWLGAAILAHAALDATAVFFAMRFGAWPTEAVVAVYALGFLAIILGLRKAHWPAPALSPTPAAPSR
ncbi:MAG: YhfC family intramembrane metalloprotease [Myxococcales bacterium]|nr:YhfC family intramembrane metalloprotease [Myxococcales bacterium]